MDQLIDVATWVGLIAALLGISLAIVAIWFTFSTESRSRRVSDQMIKSLQKIEMFVERSSVDTQELIKVGWDRMLGNMRDSPDDTSSNSSASGVKQMAEGLAEEIRADLVPSQSGQSSHIDEDRIIERVSQAVQAQLEIGQRRNRTSLSERVEDWLRVLAGLSPTAYQLMRTICRSRHLTRGEYYRLVGLGPKYSAAVRELRTTGMLVPLLSESKNVEESNQPVYWLPPAEVESIRIAFEFSPRQDEAGRHQVMEALQTVGYLQRPRSAERLATNGDQRRISSKGHQMNVEDDDSNSAEELSSSFDLQRGSIAFKLRRSAPSNLTGANGFAGQDHCSRVCGAQHRRAAGAPLTVILNGKRIGGTVGRAPAPIGLSAVPETA